MSKAVDIINAIMAPANKLVDAVTGAIGKAYEPRHIRKMAEAKAFEINSIGQALRDNADIEIQYDRQAITANTSDFEEFIKRTQSRLAFQELQKQQNIESVADKAYSLLSKETECSNEPVDKDWMIRFFNSVEDISDEDMQLLWAKLLASEVKKPRTFSLRTLETLRNMSRYDAELFERLAENIIELDSDYFIPDYSDLLDEYNIEFSDLMQLSECGLISIVGDITAYIDIPADKKEHFLLGNKKIEVYAVNKTDKNIRISIDAYPLTRNGEELFRLIKISTLDTEIEDIADLLSVKYPNVEILVEKKNFYD